MNDDIKPEEVFVFNGRTVTRGTLWWAANTARDDLYCTHNTLLTKTCDSCKSLMAKEGPSQ